MPNMASVRKKLFKWIADDIKSFVYRMEEEGWKNNREQYQIETEKLARKIVDVVENGLEYAEGGDDDV